MKTAIIFATDENSHLDYSAAITISAASVDLALTFCGTDLDNIQTADNRIGFLVSKSF